MYAMDVNVSRDRVLAADNKGYLYQYVIDHKLVLLTFRCVIRISIWYDGSKGSRDFLCGLPSYLLLSCRTLFKPESDLICGSLGVIAGKGSARQVSPS